MLSSTKNTNEQNTQFIRMTTEPVSKIIPQLAIPTVISMLVTSIYNMADTFFVSQLGTSASAAVGIVFSIMTIIQAVGFTLGMGAGSLISRKLGEKNNEAANKYASSAFFLALVFGLILAIVGLSCTDLLMKLLGSTQTILPYARNYAQYIFIGAPIMAASFVMNNTLRSEGHAKFSMIALASGGLLNIALDPLFIFAFKLGTAGAAIATLISQCVSFSIFIQFFIRKRGTVRIRVKSISLKIIDYYEIIKTGFPSLCRQGLATVSTVILNRSASLFGDSAIAGMTIVTKIIMLVASIMVGIGQGFTPVSGYNYGAKKYSRVKEAYKFTVSLGACILSIFAFILFIFAPQIIGSFIDDKEVIQIGSLALRFQAISLPFHAIIVGTNMLMQSTGKALQATFLACNRQGVYFIPLIIILPKLFNLVGVEITQAISDILSCLTAIPYIVWFFKSLKKDETKTII